MIPEELFALLVHSSARSAPFPRPSPMALLSPRGFPGFFVFYGETELPCETSAHVRWGGRENNPKTLPRVVAVDPSLCQLSTGDCLSLSKC